MFVVTILIRVIYVCITSSNEGKINMKIPCSDYVFLFITMIKKTLLTGVKVNTNEILVR